MVFLHLYLKLLMNHGKGSEEDLEPEKHWGLFKVDRTPKLVMSELYNKDTSKLIK